MYDINVRGNLSDVTKTSLAQIFEHMDADGTLHWLDYSLEPFESKKGENWGNALAVLTIEMAKNKFDYQADSAKYKLLKKSLLSKKSKFHLNEKSVLLWADALSRKENNSETVLSEEMRKSFTDELEALQNSNGSWSQSSVLGLGTYQNDAYSTAISAIGLISAGKRNTASVKKAVAWMMQNNSGSTNGLSSYPSVSINRPTRALNNGFSTDVATSYVALALKMYLER